MLIFGSGLGLVFDLVFGFWFGFWVWFLVFDIGFAFWIWFLVSPLEAGLSALRTSHDLCLAFFSAPNVIAPPTLPKKLPKNLLQNTTPPFFQSSLWAPLRTHRFSTTPFQVPRLLLRSKQSEELAASAELGQWKSDTEDQPKNSLKMFGGTIVVTLRDYWYRDHCYIDSLLKNGNKSFT